MKNQKFNNRLIITLSLAGLLLSAVMLLSCEELCLCEYETPDPDLSTTFILKSATFFEPVDLDGPGIRTETLDAKTVWLDLISGHHFCSSFEEIVYDFQYWNEADQSYYVALICIDSRIASPAFRLTGNQFDEFLYDFSFLFEDITDPTNLFDWGNEIKFNVTSVRIEDEKQIISGTSYFKSNVYTGEDAFLRFDYVFEEYFLE